MTEPLGVLGALAAFALFAWSIVAHPGAARCPRGWWLPEGARDGELVCRPRPVGVDERDARGVLVDHSVQPPGEVRIRIDCRGAHVRQDGEQAWCVP